MTLVEAIVIGASAGAIEALSAFLPALDTTYPIPIIVVVHLPPDRDSVMVSLFQTKCQIKVKEVEDKETIESATVYIAPPGYHILVEPDRRLSLSAEEPVMFSRPSIDVLFESAADAYGESLLGIVLTGGNSDGAQGLRSILDGGGKGWVQSPDTAYATAMPTYAIEACPEASVMTLPQISEDLLALGGVKRR